MHSVLTKTTNRHRFAVSSILKSATLLHPPPAKLPDSIHKFHLPALGFGRTLPPLLLNCGVGAKNYDDNPSNPRCQNLQNPKNTRTHKQACWNSGPTAKRSLFGCARCEKKTERVLIGWSQAWTITKQVASEMGDENGWGRERELCAWFYDNNADTPPPLSLMLATLGKFRRKMALFPWAGKTKHWGKSNWRVQYGFFERNGWWWKLSTNDNVYMRSAIYFN